MVPSFCDAVLVLLLHGCAMLVDLVDVPMVRSVENTSLVAAPEIVSAPVPVWPASGSAIVQGLTAVVPSRVGRFKRSQAPRAGLRSMLEALRAVAESVGVLHATAAPDSDHETAPEPPAQVPAEGSLQVLTRTVTV